MAENYSRRLDAGIIEVRFNNLQYLQIEDALGRVSGLSIVRDSWYRIGFDHKAELSGGRSIILTFPTRLGTLPADFYGGMHGQNGCRSLSVPCKRWETATHLRKF